MYLDNRVVWAYNGGLTMGRQIKVIVDRAALWQKFLISFMNCPVDRHGNHPCDNGIECHRCDHVALRFEGYVAQYENAERQRLAYVRKYDYREKHTKRNLY